MITVLLTLLTEECDFLILSTGPGEQQGSLRSDLRGLLEDRAVAAGCLENRMAGQLPALDVEH